MVISETMMKVLVVVFLLWAPNAQAYVDPGSGMLIWQGLLAVIGAFIVFVRNPWSSIKSLWKRIFGK